jgi:PAS domain S-box-containing protein
MTLSAPDFELLLQANRILSSKLDTGEVLQAVMELATKVVKAEASSLLLLDEAANELYFDVALGSVKESVKRIRLKVGEGIAGWVAKERMPLIVNDVSKDKRFSGKADKSTSFVTKSILAVPLLSKGRLIGVVEAINKELNGEFLAQDQEAFEVFGSQAAVAIENAQLFSEVTREKEKLNTVFAEMSDGVLLLDAAGKVALLNEAASRFLGAKPDQAIGKKFGKDLFPDFEPSFPVEDLASLKQKVTALDLTRRAGKDLILSCLILRLHPDQKGVDQGHLAIVHDTTEEKRGDMLKRNFLSLISHKLKTPLTVILGYAPILASTAENLSPPQKKAIKAIHDQGEHLSALVDKLLRFTLLESGTAAPALQLRDLKTLVGEAAQSLDRLFRDESAKLEIQESVAAMPKVTVDGTMMIEVFKNLIENGIKFNDKPKRAVTVSAEKSKGKIVIHVADNGVGIPPEEREKVFEKFYQIENSFTGQVPGAGLGLALCKKVVEAMGGEIGLTSQIGKGTTVSVALPFKKTTDA